MSPALPVWWATAAHPDTLSAIVRARGESMHTEPMPPPAPAGGPLYPRDAAPVDATAKPARTHWPMLLLQFVLGGIGGFALIAGFDRLVGDVSLPLLGLALVMLVAMLWMQVLVHEAGHAIAGLANGRVLVAAGVGPLRLERGVGGWQLRWGGGVQGIGGFAAMLPPHGRRESRRQLAAFMLGGPLANLLCGAAALAVLLAGPAVGDVATIALATTALCGIVLGVVNLLPFQSHGWYSDGHGLRELARDTPLVHAMRGQQDALALALAGVRPRDWPDGLLGEVPDAMPASAAAALHTLHMGRALDRDDWPAAHATALTLAGLYPGLPDGQRQGIATTLAAYAARTADAELLAAWRPLCEGGLLDLGPYRLWLDAEAAAMAGDSAAARALSAQARDAMPRIHDRAGALVMAEYLDRLDGRLAAAG